jgi:hypothetical protein
MLPLPRCKMSKSRRASEPLLNATTKRGAPPWAPLFFCVACLAPSALAQSAPGSAVKDALTDPARVVVVVDDAGDVGLRISDAQISHELVITALRKRLGQDAVAYEGTKKNAAKLKQMLGKGAETGVQDAQLSWFDAVEKSAPWRVKVRFGTKKGEHFVKATCRKRSDDGDVAGGKDVDEKVGRGKNFAAAKDDLAAQLAAFCPGLPDAASAIPIEGATSTTPATPPGMKKKEIKPWTPPPRRD